MELTEIVATINDAISMPEVAQNICGLHVQWRGNRAYCLCPVPTHNDHSVGSCILNEKFGHCFACVESFDAIKLVQMTMNTSFMEAVRIISDYYGLNLSFSRETDPIEPIVIPAEALQFAGINDVATFKKMYDENPAAAFRYLSIAITAEKNKYAKIIGTIMLPPETHPIIHHRLSVLQKADMMLPEWRQEAVNRPLRIK